MRRLRLIPLKASRQDGFTIVELMIATMVFSVIMIVITVGVISFTNSYYRGINTSTTQVTAQNIMDSISHGIQYGGTTVSTVQTSGNTSYFCAAGNSYGFTPGEEYTGDPTSTLGLFVAPNASSSNCTAPDPTDPQGKELLGNRMRVANLTITGPNTVYSNPLDPTTGTDLYTVTLQLAYGDSDLLCRTGIASGTTGSCASNSYYSSTAVVKGNDLQCRTQIGSQFCAVSSLATTVQQRIK